MALVLFLFLKSTIFQTKFIEQTLADQVVGPLSYYRSIFYSLNSIHFKTNFSSSKFVRVGTRQNQHFGAKLAGFFSVHSGGCQYSEGVSNLKHSGGVSIPKL